MMDGTKNLNIKIKNDIKTLKIKESIENKFEKDSLSEAYSENIRPFIDVIDKLRRDGLQQDINLPNVVVVGDQSSGKSSIIEAISGIQLPRGKGIVTRCPLELQLKRAVGKQWKAVLKYKTKEKYEEITLETPGSVEKHIREAQTKMCGNNKNVSKNLITLRVESPAETAPDLTLIDLPGIARIALDDQPKDICNQIKNIIMDHIRNENTVILCVISANLDAAVNESIKFAQEVDEAGTRTLGVITKPDIADEANKEDVLGLLNNEKIKLIKGFHMVKCRSQKQLEQGLSLKESLEIEKKFFENDQFYREAVPAQIGIMNLAKRITDELVGVIQATLPGLKQKIATSLQDSESKLMKLPKPVPWGEQEKLRYLIEIISDLNQEIKASLIHGKRSSNLNSLFYNWRKAFNKMRTRFDRLKEGAENLLFSQTKLEEEIMKKRGNEISGFLDFQLFVDIIQNHVMTYKEEALILLKEIKDDTCNILIKIIHAYFKNLPSVESSLKKIVLNQLEEFSKISSERINIIFEEEKLVFTMDSTFEKEREAFTSKEVENKNTVVNEPKILFGQTYTSYALSPVIHPTKDSKNESSDSLKENSKKLQEIINVYLKIVNARLSDLIPMSIRQCLHVELSESLKGKLSEFAATPNIKIEENRIVRDERIKLQNQIKRLRSAREELSKF